MKQLPSAKQGCPEWLTPSQLYFVDRIERDESVMAQVRSHSEDQVMHGLFPKKVTDAVLDALSDHEKLIMPLFEDEETGR